MGNAGRGPKWTISRSQARDGVRWHIQARTDDQLSSFAVLASDGANILRARDAQNMGDVFTLVDPATDATMNVWGDITYTGYWPKAR